MTVCLAAVQCENSVSKQLTLFPPHVHCKLWASSCVFIPTEHSLIYSIKSLILPVMYSCNFTNTQSKICMQIDTCRRKRSEVHPLGRSAPLHHVTQDQPDSHSLSCWLDDWASVAVLNRQLFSQAVGQPPCVSHIHHTHPQPSEYLSVYTDT